jgi:hypothetical protein
VKERKKQSFVNSTETVKLRTPLMESCTAIGLERN